MNIRNKQEFNNHVAKLYKYGARFEFDNVEIALLDHIMLVNGKTPMYPTRYLVNTTNGHCFWLYNGEVHTDNVLVENESEAWAELEVRCACGRLPKEKAEKILKALDGENGDDNGSDDVGAFAPETVCIQVDSNRNDNVGWQK